MRKLASLTLSLTFALTSGMSATAQPDKQPDRHPAYRGDPPPPQNLVRSEIIHTFEQRWEPVRGLLAQRYLERLYRPAPEAENAPASLPAPTATLADLVPLPPERPRAKPQAALPPAKVAMVRASIRKPDQATCVRHGMRTVWSGQSWRCRR